MGFLQALLISKPKHPPIIMDALDIDIEKARYAIGASLATGQWASDYTSDYSLALNYAAELRAQKFITQVADSQGWSEKKLAEEVRQITADFYRDTAFEKVCYHEAHVFQGVFDLATHSDGMTFGKFPRAIPRYKPGQIILDMRDFQTPDAVGAALYLTQQAEANPTAETQQLAYAALERVKVFMARHEEVNAGYFIDMNAVLRGAKERFNKDPIFKSKCEREAALFTDAYALAHTKGKPPALKNVTPGESHQARIASKPKALPGISQ